MAASVAADIAFAFQQTAVIPAIPTITTDLHTSVGWSAWLLSGYLIVASVTTPILGKLSDRHGRRWVLLGVLGTFLIASVGASLAPNIAVLVIFRAVQGFGGAVFPLTLSIVRDEAPPGRSGPAIGILTAAFGAGTLAGFGLGGLLAQEVSWRAVFGVGAVVVVAGLALSARGVPATRPSGTGPLDAAGGLLLGAVLAVLLIGLTLGPTVGWPIAAIPMATAVAGAVFWYRYERRIPAPMIDLAQLRRPPILLANLATAALGYLLFGTYFLLPHLVEAPAPGTAGVPDAAQYGFGVAAAASGLFLLPAAIGQLVAGPASSALGHRTSPRWSLSLGLLVGAVGTAGLGLFHSHAWQVVVCALLVGIASGFGIEAGSSVISHTARRTEVGVATALNSTVRRVGGGIGGQLGAALLTAYAIPGVPGTARERAFVIGFAVIAVVGLIGAVCGALIPPAEPAPG